MVHLSSLSGLFSRDDTSCFDNSWGGEDEWVGSLPERSHGPSRDSLYLNQVSWVVGSEMGDDRML